MYFRYVEMVADSFTDEYFFVFVKLLESFLETF